MKYLVLLLFALCNVVKSNVDKGTTSTLTTLAPYPVYKSLELVPSGYVPHKTYKDVTGGPDFYPSFSSYDGYPTYLKTSQLQTLNQGPFQVILGLISKTSFVLLGGIALFLVGGVFTTAICSFTSICTVSFNGVGNIDKEAMRSFMTPEKIATAAALVQDAFGKYQRLQKASNN